MSTKRVITVFSTQGKQKAKIETDVTTWGQLKPMLVAEQYNLDKLLATESVRRTDLINEGAILPETDFTVFLRPAATKSGADVSGMSYSDLRASIKLQLETGGDAASNHFNAERSYTNKSTETLRELLHDWFAMNSTSGSSPSAVLGNGDMSDEDKLALIRELAAQLNGGGHYTITIEVIDEAKNADNLETEELIKEAQEILAGYLVTIYVKA